MQFPYSIRPNFISPARIFVFAGATLALLPGLNGATPNNAAADETFLGIERERIRTIVDGVYGMEDDVDARIDSLAQEFPESSVPDFFRAARLYYLQKYARVDQALSDQFETTALTLLEKAENYSQTQKRSPEAELIVGLSQYALAIYYVDHEEWWSALWKARAGRKTLTAALRKNPDLHDAKLPLGLGNCYLSTVPTYLKPFAALLGPGNMETGLKQLEDAAGHGLFSAVDAIYYQAAVKAELSNDAEAARKIMEPLVGRFPGNPEFQFFLSRLEYHSGLKEESEARVAGLLKMPQAEPFPALKARAVLNMVWDAMREQRYEDALALANASEKLVDSDPLLENMRSESILAQAEANKAVGEIDAALERFKAIPASDERNHKHAQNRIAQITSETGRTD